MYCCILWWLAPSMGCDSCLSFLLNASSVLQLSGSSWSLSCSLSTYIRHGSSCQGVWTCTLFHHSSSALKTFSSLLTTFHHLAILLPWVTLYSLLTSTFAPVRRMMASITVADAQTLGVPQIFCSEGIGLDCCLGLGVFTLHLPINLVSICWIGSRLECRLWWSLAHAIVPMHSLSLPLSLLSHNIPCTLTLEASLPWCSNCCDSGWEAALVHTHGQSGC